MFFSLNMLLLVVLLNLELCNVFFIDLDTDLVHIIIYLQEKVQTSVFSFCICQRVRHDNDIVI